MIVSLRDVALDQMKTLRTRFTIPMAKTGSMMTQVSVVIQTVVNQVHQMMYHNQTGIQGSKKKQATGNGQKGKKQLS